MNVCVTRHAVVVVPQGRPVLLRGRTAVNAPVTRVVAADAPLVSNVISTPIQQPAVCVSHRSAAIAQRVTFATCLRAAAFVTRYAVAIVRRVPIVMVTPDHPPAASVSATPPVVVAVCLGKFVTRIPIRPPAASVLSIQVVGLAVNAT